MNSIIVNHFGVADTPTEALEAALDRLGAWLDAESVTLARVLAQADCRNAASALKVLAHLHLEPMAEAQGIRELLEESRCCLEVILEALLGIPSGCPLTTASGQDGPEPLDTHVRWSGARVQDILSTVSRALDS